MKRNTLVLFLAFVLPPNILFAAEGASKTPAWYEVIGGILAIPAAVLGLAYSYILIKKTKLESRKTELEIKEKQKALKGVEEEYEAVSKGIIEPLLEEKLGKYLVLRFVLLYVTLKLWGLATSAFSFITGGIFLGAQKLTEGTMVGDSWLILPFYVVSNMPQIVTWLIILGIGWPLFKDVNSYLNIDIKKLLMPWKK